MRFLSVLLASWFYSGFIPPFLLRGMAGTYGSLASLPLCWALLYFGQENAGIWFGWTIPIIFALGLLTVKDAEMAIGPRTDWKGKTKYHDQNQIVVDETFGMLITCIPMIWMPVEHLFWTLFVAFLLFRLFDIIKVWPTRVFDRMHSAFGVMMDDAIAGIYAAILLWLAIKYLSL